MSRLDLWPKNADATLYYEGLQVSVKPSPGAEGLSRRRTPQRSCPLEVIKDADLEVP